MKLMQKSNFKRKTRHFNENKEVLDYLRYTLEKLQNFSFNRGFYSKSNYPEQFYD